MMGIANVCFPQEATPEKVKRVQQSMHHQLKIALGPNFYKSTEDLFSACRTVESSIKQKDKMENTHTKLPPSTQQHYAKSNYKGKH